MRRELQLEQESRQAQDGEISVLEALVEQLMGQVKGKGKGSDPIPEASGAGGGSPPPLRQEVAEAAGGGNPPPPPPRRRQELQAEVAEETSMIREKDLGGDQMRAGREDQTRDLHSSQKTTMTQRTTNSLTCSPESWPMPWDNVQQSQWNPLPCSKMRNTKIYACGY